jgi:hypothetical protein
VPHARLGLVVLSAGLAVAGCGPAQLANGEPCVRTNALGTTVWNGGATNGKVQVVNVLPGDTVTMQLIEPEGYASAADARHLPQVFPWLTPQSSDPRVLKPIAVCTFPQYVTTLSETLTAFSATGSGDATIIAPVNPASPNPPPMPGFAPPQPFQVTVIVAQSWVPWAIRAGWVIAILMVASMVLIWQPWKLSPTPRSNN